MITRSNWWFSFQGFFLTFYLLSGGGWLHYYYIKRIKHLHGRGDNERFIARCIFALYSSLQTALIYCPIKQRYQAALSTALFWALPCLALQGALSPLPRPGVSYSSREILANFEYNPAITEYKTRKTSPNEQKRDHPVDQSEWPSQKIPEKIWRTFRPHSDS